MAVDLIPGLGPAVETLLWVALLSGAFVVIPFLEIWDNPDDEDIEYPPL